MKKLILLFLLASSFVNYAQEDDYMPLFNKDGVQKWTQFYEYRDMPSHYATHTTISSPDLGDTIFNNLTFKKLLTHVSEVKSNNTTEYYITDYVREENKKIFYLDYDYSPYASEMTVRLLFDFSLSIGDTFTLRPGYPETYQVKNIDTIEINGQARRRFYVGPLKDNKYIYWIEGTGCTSGLFVTPAVVYRGANHLHIYLHCHLHNDEILYNYYNRCNNVLDVDEIIFNANNNIPPKISVFPNPANNFINVNISPYTENNYIFSLFDIQGNKIIEQSLLKNNQLISTKHLNEGSYIYNIISNNKIINSDVLIIEK